MKYFLDSIDLENCLKSKEDDLNSLQICENCSKLPLPAYRSSKEPERFLCKTCFLSLNMKMEHVISNTQLELKLLERLVFRCKNHTEGCEKEFKVDELEKLIIHQENCCKNFISSMFKKCKLCQISIIKDKVHYCSLKFSKDIDKKMNLLIEILNKKIEIIQKSRNILGEKEMQSRGTWFCGARGHEGGD